MVQRVVVVDGNQIAAENLSNFVMGTYIGVGALMFGLYWLVGFFTPHFLADDLGLLTYIIAPAAILLSAFFLLVVLMCAISFEDPITQIAYSAGISYISVPIIRDMGWIGYSDTGKVIGYILVFAIAFALLNKLMKYSFVLKATKVVGGIAIFGALLFPFTNSTMDILKSAGWL
ncbi:MULTISPECIES: hypothetical protein [Gammaproteobacteria]|uniref:hypothetical protein n=1 Tax=Gammaproteobacteria TaxID=1236 RepID=UPI000DCFE76C|nr:MULTISPECIES: hypothetical protein [Gammaproteobacteria]RTE86959.1 hypothetical protein DQX04_00790 [Aliidiomarina sp. B3213]TCZ93251.1 hypothetical protein EYQ95_04510 [Lysobacter sp. N42]